LWEKYQNGHKRGYSPVSEKNIQLCHLTSPNTSTRILELLGHVPVDVRKIPTTTWTAISQGDFATNQLCTEILRETNYSIKELALHVSLNEPLLVPDQKAAYNHILHHVGEN
jgi:hypothetical protein